jgi:glycopeptide antibiotics resistance protein
MTNQASQPCQASANWSNRILVASLIGIAYLTLFPFHFDFARGGLLHTSPFLLGASVKKVQSMDFLLNVLLFVPFGFGIYAQLRKRSAGRRAVLLAVVLAAGAITSYIVELLQLYIPPRNSGWDDVVSNTVGAAVGFFLFDRWGESWLQRLSGWEERAETWSSFRATWIFLLVYLGFFLAISIPLQGETRLSNWDTTSLLSAGSDGTARHAWKGQIAKLQIWNQALSEETARKLTSGEAPPDSETGLRASYEFAGMPPYNDQKKFLPTLSSISSSPSPHDSKTLDLDGSSWLSSIVPAKDLAQELTKTNQLAVRAVCTPADAADLEQFIVSISQVHRTPNLTLRREGADLIVWFRTPLFIHRSGANRYVGDIRVMGVFAVGQARDILISYDGSDVSLYVDGKKERRVHHLSPGASLAQRFSRMKTSEWDGYLVTYDALIFLPAGCLLAVIARKGPSQKFAARLLLPLGFVLPPLLYEFILVWVSGRPASLWQVSLCLFVTLIGVLLTNADRRDGILLCVR